ncbi:helix-turn-helix domain-containing protein [Streptococcus suis]|uniref:helix-turn-helix domain-containing protein n=1 Tax=Streptococcus TaxID=1301 RepID=UPI00201A5983|nr:helix-turn-helix domain-containing protein [Streptococcus suis]MCL4923465.1 helix-turn-helix domain-containing protein [Streptococcus suis]
MLPQNNSPLLLNRQQAAELLGIDPKSFDKYIRSHPDFQYFMVGKQERYLKSKLIKFIENHCD